MLIRLADLFARYTRWFILVAAAFVGASGAYWAWTSAIDHRVEGVRHTIFAKPPSGETVIIEIDARSLDEVHSWPWPRSLHGRLTDRLREAGARQIAFDIDFSNPAAEPAQDAAFAAAIARTSGRVILPALLENADGQFGRRVDVLPSAPLARHARIGTIWIRLDLDAEARRLPYSVEIAGRARPSLATALSDRAVTGLATVPLDWSFEWQRFPRISYADVLAGRYDPAFFRGKNVLVGATSVTLGDRFSVPTHARIPGVYVQAVGSETLRRFIPREIGRWPAFLFALVLIAIGAVIRRPALRSTALGIAIGAAAAAPMLVREYTGIISEPGPGLVAALAALAISIAGGITAAGLARVTRAPISQLPNLTAMCISEAEAGTTVVVRLRNHSETTAFLGAEGQGELMRRVADRIALAAGGATIFQVDDHSFAFRAPGVLAAVADSVEGLHALLTSGIKVGERTVDVTISVGICDDSALDTESAVAAAMAAASRAERRGLNWERYESEDDNDADWRLSLLNELDRALDNGDVWVAYQPKFDLKAGTICGAEALVRWSHPLRGEIRPDQFIPTLEDNGRIEKLTLHVLETAIRDFARLDEELTVAVNISAKMIGRKRLLEPIRDMLETERMDARRLTLEITESAALAGSAGIEELNSLRRLGVEISIDDYGTGQSTLSYLKTLPATELKIDRSFVGLISVSRSDAAVVDSTVKLAHALGLIVVAEGVESEEVLALLRQMNCDMVQGYYIGEPAGIDTLIERLASGHPLRVVRNR
jgi:EAL domain-containing protein (putative c-di-GMP-specific phosphodiesterase class I)/CHASE2 domain-containing sensor protein